MKILTENDFKEYIKNPRYLTLCHQDTKLLRLDLCCIDDIYHFFFNDIRTGKTFVGSEDLEKVLEVLNKRGGKIVIFDSITEYYKYIVDFLS